MFKNEDINLLFANKTQFQFSMIMIKTQPLSLKMLLSTTQKEQNYINW